MKIIFILYFPSASMSSIKFSLRKQTKNQKNKICEGTNTFVLGLKLFQLTNYHMKLSLMLLS